MNTGTERVQLEHRRGTETILLVEDEDSLRIVICDFLSQLGYTLLSAGSGEEALNLGQSYSGNIDLLLTDVFMPGISGPELAEKLLGARPGIKVMYVSGYADTDCTLEPQGVQGNVLLQKPFTIKTLTVKLREVLGEDKEVNDNHSA
ncbi:MAG TPA: response regulator [Candidatus Solibacter sp.]|nr:response regulator [Candidatus Solibacter sp.]